MTYGEMRTRVATALNDPDGIYWSSDDLDAMLHEAEEVFVEEAPYVRRTITIPRRPGVAIYHVAGVAPNLLAPYRLWLPDLHRKLEPVSLTTLDARHEEWLTVSGEPWWWAAVDWRQFVIWPVPSDGGWIQVDYYAWPDDILDAGDIPEYHESQQEALLFYAEALGHLRQWDVNRAADRMQAFARRALVGESKANITQSMSRFWARSEHRDQHDGNSR